MTNKELMVKLENRIEAFKYDRRQIYFKFDLCHTLGFTAEEAKLNNSKKYFDIMIDELSLILDSLKVIEKDKPNE